MEDETNKILAKLAYRPGADTAQIFETERQLDVRLPDDYREFLEFSNGAEGFIGDNYLDLWRVEDLPVRNKHYEVHRYAPGLFIFGSDGGGEAFGFDVRTPKVRVVQMPFVGMEWGVALEVGNSFTEFIHGMKR